MEKTAPSTAPRIAPVPPPYEAAIADTFSKVMPPGMEPLSLFSTMARNPRVLHKMFAGGLLDRGAISLREREILILRTTAACGSEYEWGVHVALFATHAKLTEAEVRATLEFPSTASGWTGQEALLLQLADALHQHSTVPDAIWDKLATHYSDEQLLEMLAIVGYYHTISFMANAIRLAPEKFAARFAKASE